MDFQCGCVGGAPSAPDPIAKRSAYFEDVSASFAIAHGGPKLSARYSWLVEAHKPLPKGAIVEAEFEDPADKSQPWRIRGMEVNDDNHKLQPGVKRYYFISPPLDFIECKTYPLKLKAYTDYTRTKVLAQHDNIVRSKIDTENCPTAEFMERMQRMQQEWREVPRQ